MSKLWFKDAVFYELYIRAFSDSNGDGIGDFKGLITKLDYLVDLGIDCIWILPMYPSPGKDDGYDIMDYTQINEDYGTLKDFKHFLKEAHKRGLRVIADLVLNHVSDQHPWFQEALANPKSPKIDYFVWSDDPHKFTDARIIFIDSELSNWTWSEEVGKFYWHRFFHHQPDLNFDNPAIRDEMMDIMRFWLDLGLDGFRADAVPYLFVRENTNGENLPETHAYLKEVRKMMDEEYPDAILLAEANQWPSDLREYFGDGDEFHMAFNFPIMPRMFMAIQQEHHGPIVDIVKQTPEIPENCQWAIFLRNHDELTLEMCTDKERDYMYEKYAKEKRMKLNVGIRRRLLPLLEKDLIKVELLYAMLLSLPGSPVLYYGDEIGMGDNVYLGDRMGVRTPMQWNEDRNAGFSKSKPSQLYAPVITDPGYSYVGVNVELQQNESSSLYNKIKRLLAMRKRYPVLARGSLVFSYPDNKKILVYHRDYNDEVVLCVFNMAATAQPVEIDLKEFNGHIPLEMLGETQFPEIGELPYLLTLSSHSFYMFYLVAPEQRDEMLSDETAISDDEYGFVLTENNDS